jgi:hypothetical protein
MSRKPRNSDGTIRRVNKPERLTNRSIIARWVETETLHVKQLGMSFQAIADHIVGVAQGSQKAFIAAPQDIHFPDGYRISVQAVHRAFRRAIVRLPNAEAAELRKLDSERLEEMLLSLQAGIRQGDPRSIEVGVRVLTHKAELNGYKSPARVEMSGTHLVQAAADAQVLVNLGRLTVEELREYRKLEAKARGSIEAAEIQTTKASETPIGQEPPADSQAGKTDGDDNGCTD